MISVAEASSLIKKHLPDWGNVTIATENLPAAILAQELKADRAYPPYQRAMMDGIALNWKFFERGQRHFKIEDRALAGLAPKTLGDPSACMEIMTGAVVPTNCDLVIPYEQLAIVDGVAQVNAQVPAKQWDNIHAEASDCKAGDTVLGINRHMNGPHWGIAASMGYRELLVKRHPRVLVVSTGDELVDLDQTPLPHQIRRSNSYAIKASLVAHGHHDVDLAHLLDRPEDIARHFENNVKNYDVMIYSGGVSKGKTDYLPALWRELGVSNYFHGVAQRPGKPLWFGVDHRDGCAIFGMPGNPVSSLVCLHRYFLHKKSWYAKLSCDFHFDRNLTYFVPVTLESTVNGELVAHPHAIKNSGEFTALADSDGFLELAQEKNFFAKGTSYPFYSWSPH